jgi:transcription antitermination factor NusG
MRLSLSFVTGSHEVCFELNAITLQTEYEKGNNRQWLAAYVKMHHEKKIRDRLTSMGIENFLPVKRESHQWSDRQKDVERVLIPMMIFVRVNNVEKISVLSLPTVFRYLTLRGEHRPAIIPDRQMDRFRFMLDHAEDPVEFHIEALNPGDKIRVIKGALTGLEGELVNVDGKSSIAVRIEQLGCAMVRIETAYIEVFKPIPSADS